MSITVRNPFTYGNPISDPSRFFGREREITQIFNRLCNVELESSSLVGERRIGKTSLLSYIARPEVRQAHGLDPDAYFVVYQDLQIPSLAASPTKLWQRLLQQIARQCPDDEINQRIETIRKSNENGTGNDEMDNFVLDELFDLIDEKDMHVIFLFDEFETITDNPNFGIDFYNGMRSLAIHHNLAIITASRHELIELCQSEEIRASPFFNIFATISMRLLSEEDARQLIDAYLADSGVSFTDAEIGTVRIISGCHPYFLQVACHFLFESYRTALGPNARLTFMRARFREEATPHLGDFWRVSNDHEKIVLTAITLLARQGDGKVSGFRADQLTDVYSRSEQTLERLGKRGLLVTGGETYALFSPILGEWIISEITNTLNDRHGYDEWLASNNGRLTGFSGVAKREIGEILPKIGSSYRDLIITWVSDPKNLLTVAALLRGVVGFG